jgi:hypothetical protein
MNKTNNPFSWMSPDEEEEVPQPQQMTIDRLLELLNEYKKRYGGQAEVLINNGSGIITEIRPSRGRLIILYPTLDEYPSDCESDEE